MEVNYAIKVGAFDPHSNTEVFKGNLGELGGVMGVADKEKGVRPSSGWSVSFFPSIYHQI